MQANKYYKHKRNLISGNFMALEPLSDDCWKVWHFERRQIILLDPVEYEEIDQNFFAADYKVFDLPEYHEEVRMYEFGEALDKKYRVFGSNAWRCIRYKNNKYEALDELSSAFGRQTSAFINGSMEEVNGSEFLLKCLKDIDTEYKTLLSIIEDYFETKEIPDGFLSADAS